MVTMDRIGDLLHENLYKWFGLSDKMLSDRGPQFTAKAFRAMLSRLGVNLVLSMAYPLPLVFEIQCAVFETQCNLNQCCTHAFLLWSDPSLYNIFATSSPLLLLLIPSQSFTPFSILCRTMMTTTLPLRTHKIMTQHNILLYLPPTTLQQLLALQELLRRQLGSGLNKKSTSFLTMLKKVAF
jgi:hypothetical protein